MNKDDRLFFNDIRKMLNDVYWKICDGKSNGAGEIEAIEFLIALHLNPDMYVD